MRKLLLILLMLVTGATAQTTSTPFDADLASAQIAPNQLYNDAKDISGQLVNQLTLANTQVNSLQAQVTTAQAQASALQNQLALCQSKVVDVKRISGLERGPYGVNTIGSQIGGSSLGVATFTPPSIQTAHFTLTPAAPYFDAYFSTKPGADNTRVRFTYSMRFLLSDGLAPQALEFEIKNPVHGKMFAAAFQLAFVNGFIRWYDYHQHAWLSTGIPLVRLSAGVWHTFSFTWHRDATTYFYESVTLDGVTTPLTQSVAADPTNWSDNIIVAYQSDGNGRSTPFTVYVDSFEVLGYGTL